MYVHMCVCMNLFCYCCYGCDFMLACERTLFLTLLSRLSLVHSLSYALAIRIFYFAVACSIRHLLCLIRHSFAYTINNIAFLFSFSIDSQHSRAFVFD